MDLLVLFHVSLHVTVEVELCAESLLADLALELPDTVVVIKVLGEVARLSERGGAALKMAFEWAFTSMNAKVVEEVASLLELLAAAFIAADKSLPVALGLIVDVMFDFEVACFRNIFRVADFMEVRFLTSKI